MGSSRALPMPSIKACAFPMSIRRLKAVHCPRHTAGSKSWDSKPAMRLSLARTSRLSAAVVGAPCTREGMAPCLSPCCNVAVLNFSPRAGSSSSKARCDLQDAQPSFFSSLALEGGTSCTLIQSLCNLTRAISVVESHAVGITLGSAGAQRTHSVHPKMEGLLLQDGLRTSGSLKGCNTPSTDSHNIFSMRTLL